MKKVSVLIPTRKRYEMFSKSVDSLFNTCNNIDNFEVLVALDNDDIETIEKIKEYSIQRPNVKSFYYERYGYKGLNLYINDLCIKASGTSLFLWNDDAIMKSQDWDLEILKHHEKFCVISPKVENMEDFWMNKGVLFPILPKKWVEITGEFSHHPSCDSWIDVLGKRLNLIDKKESIVIYHDRYELTGNNQDETYGDVRKDVSFGFSHFPEIWEEHFTKLNSYLNH